MKFKIVKHYDDWTSKDVDFFNDTYGEKNVKLVATVMHDHLSSTASLIFESDIKSNLDGNP